MTEIKDSNGYSPLELNNLGNKYELFVWNTHGVSVRLNPVSPRHTHTIISV